MTVPYEIFKIRFQKTANAVAARYGAPVYLVGSALRKQKPRDYDVRLILRECDMDRLYGDWKAKGTLKDQWAPWEWKRAYDNLKQSRIFSKRMRCNIDFQAQTYAEAMEYQPERMVRLDSAPLWFFKAGLQEFPGQ